MHHPIQKVTAFITREGEPGPELLVFEHEHMPEAGIQVPAGTVEISEPIEQAVLREAWEETGLKTFHIERDLGVLSIELPTPYYVLLEAATLLTRPDGEPIDHPDAQLRRAWNIQLEQIAGEWARVTFKDKYEPAKGWILASQITNQLTRYRYHLTLLEPAPDRWEIFAEGRYTFCLYWLPLVPRPRLVSSQDSWLNIHEQLIDYYK
jgi:ADP-ribose pyrophosphatase YjhB (NUDIX family)